MRHLFLLLSLFLYIQSTLAQNEDFSPSNKPIAKPEQKQFDQSILYPPFRTEDPFILPDNLQMSLKIESHKNKTFFNSPYSRFIMPTAFISYGLLSRVCKPLRNLDFNTKDRISQNFIDIVPHDNYLQYVPAVAVYGLDLAGIKAKHNIRDRTIVLASSYLLMGATVYSMKMSFSVDRPDGSNSRSFPSGHTATAFVGAHILYKEYKDTSFWIGAVGYAGAIGTGIMRTTNKKHWVSDVVAGAGIGILSAEIGYILLPVWNNVFGIRDKDKSLVVVPVINAQSTGMGLSYRF